MNILMLHPHDIHSTFEPWTVRIVYIAKELIKKGHSVKLVYFPLERQEQGPRQLSDGLVALPLSRRHGPGVLIRNIAYVYKLAAWADVVHVQKCFYQAVLPAITAAVLRGKPLHYDWDDWEVKIYEASAAPGRLKGFIQGFLGILENTLPRLADTVSVASGRLKEECTKLGIDRAKIFDAHVGADIAKFHPGVSGQRVRKKYNIQNPLVLYLGQLHGGQYVELFIETAARLLRQHQQDLSFMIVGDGYRAQELKRIAEQKQLNGSLIFTGAVSHELVPEYVAAADVCVACFEENEVTVCKSPLKIVEYLSSGKAIVASSVGEVPHMLQEAGILVQPGSATSLAEGILRIIRDGSLRQRLEAGARKRAQEEYNWTVTTENILRAYAEALRLSGRHALEKRR
ncbi:MAG TPA: glycosyltransferase family 4 protein [Patescibacteria group bacterium]|nr:glycosyltransferase family 4 protein [Patescibacteria group bacterium]